ncbi:MAG: RNA polymerase sigma factor [Sandaracinaceae bacterium]
MGTDAARAADRSLARRCAAGDADAQRALFQAHRERVHVVLYRILGTNREMEDLAQEAFLEIFRSLPRFRGEAQLSTWVDRITTRVATRHLRRKKGTPARLEAVAEPVDGDDPARTVELREVARRLYGVLDALSPEMRIAYALHVVDGRPLREVAKLTDATLVATKTRVWRARRAVEARAARDPVLAEWVG